MSEYIYVDSEPAIMILLYHYWFTQGSMYGP